MLIIVIIELYVATIASPHFCSLRNRSMQIA